MGLSHFGDSCRIGGQGFACNRDGIINGPRLQRADVQDKTVAQNDGALHEERAGGSLRAGARCKDSKNATLRTNGTFVRFSPFRRPFRGTLAYPPIAFALDHG